MIQAETTIAIGIDIGQMVATNNDPSRLYLRFLVTHDSESANMAHNAIAM